MKLAISNDFEVCILFLSVDNMMLILKIEGEMACGDAVVVCQLRDPVGVWCH